MRKVKKEIGRQRDRKTEWEEKKVKKDDGIEMTELMLAAVKEQDWRIAGISIDWKDTAFYLKSFFFPDILTEEETHLVEHSKEKVRGGAWPSKRNTRVTTGVGGMHST